MAEIKNTDQNPVIDYTARDYQSLLAAMRAVIPEKTPEWLDFESESDFGNVLLETFAHAADILSFYQDRMVNECFPATARSRRSIIQHLRLIGYTLATAAPATADLEISLPSDCVEVLAIKPGDAFGTTGTDDEPGLRFEYVGEVDLKIDAATLPVENTPDGPRKIYRALRVSEGETFRDEYLGVSDGSIDQTFPLLHSGVMLRESGAVDVKLISIEQGRRQEWTRRETLAFSRRGLREFTIEVDEADVATVIFGDRMFGAIPAPGAELRVTYRTGGGAHGNVGRRAITTILDAPALTLVGAEVLNPMPATGGADRESARQAVEQAPRVFRSLGRAVSARDYTALALRYPGVGKVRAESANSNTVALYVAPSGGGYASDTLRAELLDYFEDKRMLTHRIEVRDVQYVKIFFAVNVGVLSNYAPPGVRTAVEDLVRELLAFENVDFGQIFYISKLYQALESVPGVEYITVTEFRRESDATQTAIDGKIVLSEGEIPRAPDDPTDDPAYASGVKVRIVRGGAS